MTDPERTRLSRRGFMSMCAAGAALAAPSSAKAAGFFGFGGSGDIRRISMYSGRSGETLNTIYWIDGDYIPEALAEISHFMRDLRTDAVKTIDTRTIDIMAAAHNLLETDEPYMLLSGYRTPQSNAILRSRRNGAARNSLHMTGQAADLRLRSRSAGQIAKAAIACAAGGVGHYSGANFVHVDCGTPRTWVR